MGTSHTSWYGSKMIDGGFLCRLLETRTKQQEELRTKENQTTTKKNQTHMPRTVKSRPEATTAGASEAKAPWVTSVQNQKLVKLLVASIAMIAAFRGSSKGQLEANL